jgi:hypothetical protein
MRMPLLLSLRETAVRKSWALCHVKGEPAGCFGKHANVPVPGWYGMVQYGHGTVDSHDKMIHRRHKGFRLYSYSFYGGFLLLYL